MNLPSIVFQKDRLAQFDQAQQNEWLITNGLGGYASSTILGLNNRKYHALLVAALRPPGERTIILSKLDEDINVEGHTYQLGANDFNHDIYPKGFQFLTNFSISPFPTYTYTAENIELKKTIFLPYWSNSSIALYQVKNDSSSEATVSVYPLVSYRHFHYTINRKEKPVWLNQTQSDNTVELVFDNPASTVILKAVDGTFNSKPTWIEGLFYREEADRGESSMDESYQPGYFEFKVPQNSATKFVIAAHVAENRDSALRALDSFGLNNEDFEKLLSEELRRRENIVTAFYSSNNQVSVNDGLSWLLQAANDFIVKGTSDRRFVIAGYQWFGSWGRDTFVSLPGLMLVSGRFEDANSVILDYTGYCKQGLIPNLIDDKTGEPLYNTVDGTLWYINSILQYLKYTGDFQFVKNSLWLTLKDIVENYKRGTINGIHVNDDGLLAHGPQLTWMDTIVDGQPYTPRAGKAVEVQALWYNSLMTLRLLAERFEEKSLADEFWAMAQKAKSSFNDKFWDNEKNCLYDLIDEEGRPDFSIRPNQVIAGSLDFSIIDKEKNESIVNFVQTELLTPAGLRTLSPKDSRYKGRYEGDRNNRDKAYHNGSIWAWLTGPLTTAYLKANDYSRQNIESAYQKFIMPLFTDEVAHGGLGTLNEINDGDFPYTPRGCIAQAWSVAEPLRAYVEDILLVRPKFENEVIRPVQKITA